MKRLLAGIIVLVLASFVVVVPAPASAQLCDNPPPNDQNCDGIMDVDSSTGLSEAKFTTDEFQAYKEATATCEAPSLECLVKNTTRFTAMEWIFNIMGGTSTGNNKPDDISGTNPAGAELRTPRGFVDGTFQLIGAMYTTPPASKQAYIADVARSAGITIATPAYAQGLGFAALDPVLELWKIFRNIAYMFFVVIFIGIGFMIMFRQKISGSAVVTAQQAIPSIIASLIMVTFSYAIAGFMIDLMYVIMYLLIGIFFNPLVAPSTLTYDLVGLNIFQLGWTMISGVAWGNGMQNNIDIVGQFIRSASSSSNIAIDALGWIGGITLSLVLAIAMLIATFKLFFELLKSYVSIVLYTVTAPLFLMMGAIPGNNVFVPWIKALAGNLAAFPTVLMVMIMFFIFTDGARQGGGGFMPPFLFGGGQSGIIGPVMGLAIILALPELVKKAKDAFGAKDGIGMEIFNAASGRMSEAWNKGAGIGPSGKTIAKGAGLLGAAALAAPATAALGAYVAPKFGQRKLTGALAGVAAPVLAAGIPLGLKGVGLANRLGRGVQDMGKTISVISQVGGAILSNRAVQNQFNEEDEQQGKYKLGNKNIKEMGKIDNNTVQSTIKNAPAASSAPSIRNTGTDAV